MPPSPSPIICNCPNLAVGATPCVCTTPTVSTPSPLPVGVGTPITGSGMLGPILLLMIGAAALSSGIRRLRS